ncbi:hypothetical protein MASR1M45_29140 [Candidatus Kapaibacterium sp.]
MTFIRMSTAIIKAVALYMILQGYFRIIYESDSEHDDNQTDKHPFPHTHLLQGHTLVQTISTVVVKFATGLDYIICCRFEPTNIADVTKSTYLIDKLIYYESAWGTKMMLRAPPHIFKSYFS